MKTLHLPFSRVESFISHIRAYGDVFAPHKKGDASFTFEQVIDTKDTVLDYNRTLHSIKKYFLPAREELLSFSMDDYSTSQNDISQTPRIFLGVHSYDMQAVLKLDYNFTQGNPEKNYLSRRKNATFIGVSYTPDDYHFGRSVGITIEETDGFDIFMDRTVDGYILNVLTDRGHELIQDFAHVVSVTKSEKQNHEFKNKIKFNYNRLTDVFDHAWNSTVWADVADQCVGCGTCNLVCPTCYCFNVEDDVSLDLKSGSRERTWDGCMLNSFAAVAGGENFRHGLDERQRHRIYRKFKYISDITGEPWCVGCGRCTAYCTAGISIVDIVNQLSADYERDHLQPVQTHTL